LFKHKPLCSLVAAAFLCIAVLISPVTAHADSAGGLTLVVTPSVTAASLGENISFNYVITSTCNTTINSLVLTDDRFGTISLPATSFATGGTLTVSIVHAVVSTDFPGPFATNATITGVSADNATLSAGAASSVALNPLASSLTVTLAADKSAASVGDNISYTYAVTNTGQAALNSIVLSDSRLGSVALGSTTLAAGASLTASKTYTVLSSNRPGPLTSSVTATAISASGVTLTARSITDKIALGTNNGDDDEDNHSDNRTRADHLRDRGVPGKGIDHAPGLQKPFNPNSHGGGHESDNRTSDHDDNGGNGHGNSNNNNNGNGHDNGKGNK
jgi:hypothetical protein